MGWELVLLQGLIRVGHASLLRPLSQHWLATEPDLVVSLVPNSNACPCESLASTLPGVPYVTVMTDMADRPRHFWIEPGQVQHLVCGAPQAIAQARAAGCASECLSLTCPRTAGAWPPPTTAPSSTVPEILDMSMRSAAALPQPASLVAFAA